MVRRKKTTSINFIKRFCFEYEGDKIGLGIVGGVRSDQRFVEDPNGIYVANVDKKSAAFNYIFPNDQILSINQISILSKTHKQVVEIFRSSKKKIELEIKRSIRSSPTLLGFSKLNTFVSFDVEEGCGFEYSLTSWPSNSTAGMYHMVVTSVTAYGSAYGSLLIKDVIIKINRIEVIGLCIKEIENIIENSNGSLAIEIMRKPSFVNSYSKMKNQLSKQKHIRIEREQNSMYGFGLIGGIKKIPVFVVSVDAFTPADYSGLKPGDIILKVDDIDVSGMSHEEVTDILRISLGVDLLIQRNYSVDFLLKRYINRSSLTDSSTLWNEKSFELSDLINTDDEANEVVSFYVRALTDYDPSEDRNIPAKSFSFKFGDIIYITNGNDCDWWQGKLYKTECGEAEEELGVIPSNNRFRNKKLQNLKKVKFSIDNNTNKSKILKSPSPKHSIRKSKLNETNRAEMFYEMITKETIEYSHRPVILMGEQTENIKCLLLTSYPKMFALPTRYTTKLKKRPKFYKQKLVEFEALQICANEGMFVGLSQHKDYYYAYKLEEIFENCRNKIHTIIEFNSIRMQVLRQHMLYPAVFFIRPPDLNYVKEWNKRITDEEAERIFKICTKLEQENKNIISCVVEANLTIKNIIDEITNFVEKSESNEFWVPATNNIF